MKPVKPYEGFPLTPHARGGWVKKYKRRLVSIAARDPGRALEEWFAKKRLIDAGRPARLTRTPRLESATVGWVTTRYAKERRLDAEAGRLTYTQLQKYRNICLEMVDVLGRDTPVAELVPDDFTRFRRHLEDRRLGSHALARAIQMVRSIWKYAEDNDWIDRRPKFGAVFRKESPGRKQGTPFTPGDILRLAACCENLQLEAMILLMYNCGYTGKDCSSLPRAAVDLKKGVIVFPRPKMARRQPIDRACTLWPETIEALKEVLEQRKADPEGLVFRTIHGRRWVREGVSDNDKGGGIDSVGRMFRKLCDKVPGLEPRGPGWIRHLHRTGADELERPSAAARIMGHRLPGLAEVYVDHIEHGRLEQITSHLRSKFLAHLPPE